MISYESKLKIFLINGKSFFYFLAHIICQEDGISSNLIKDRIDVTDFCEWLKKQRKKIVPNIKK